MRREAKVCLRSCKRMRRSPALARAVKDSPFEVGSPERTALLVAKHSIRHGTPTLRQSLASTLGARPVGRGPPLGDVNKISVLSRSTCFNLSSIFKAREFSCHFNSYAPRRY